MSRIIINVIIPIFDILVISDLYLRLALKGLRGGEKERKRVRKTNLELEDKDQFQTFSPLLWTILSSCFEGFYIRLLCLWVNT
jgi:hypothetical protein